MDRWTNWSHIVRTGTASITVSAGFGVRRAKTPGVPGTTELIGARNGTALGAYPSPSGGNAGGLSSDGATGGLSCFENGGGVSGGAGAKVALGKIVIGDSHESMLTKDLLKSSSIHGISDMDSHSFCRK